MDMKRHALIFFSSMLVGKERGEIVTRITCSYLKRSEVVTRIKIFIKKEVRWLGLEVK
jgi:hypothetical protein